VRSGGGDHSGAEGNIRHEMAVHDVEVQPIGTSAGGTGGFRAQTREIGGEQ